MQYQAHRGVSSEFPENTIPAFRAAVMQEYDIIELDPAVTSDGKLIVFHDKVLDRTLRLPDGSPIRELGKAVAETSLDEILSYDAGIRNGRKFAGTKVPTLEEAFIFAAENKIRVKIDNKMFRFFPKNIQEIFDLAEKTGVRAEFTCPSADDVKTVLERFPDAVIHYDGYPDEDHFAAVKALTGDNRLTIWLPIESKLTGWVKIPFADEELCRTAKKYGELGLWILSREDELESAEKFGASVIETTGHVKPERHESGAIDMHCHTEFSHDSVCKIEEHIKKAEAEGLGGFAVTDHCDIEFAQRSDVHTRIRHSVESVNKARDAACTKILLSGIEVGEGIYFPDVEKEIVTENKYDVILGSAHAARSKITYSPYSHIDFPQYSDEDIYGYIDTYFDDIAEMIENTDFDVLAHLTCPIRYTNGKFGKNIDLSRFDEKIDRILETIIKKSIALEVNTSGIRSGYGDYLPSRAIITRYRKMGGYLITLASDAHIPDHLGRGFSEAREFLKSVGFKNAYYYLDRVPIQYEL